jgi:hypothetical protein
VDRLPTWNAQLPNAIDAASHASTRLDTIANLDDVSASGGIVGRVGLAVINVRLDLVVLALGAVQLST